MMVFKNEFMPTYLLCKYFFFYFEKMSDPVFIYNFFFRILFTVSNKGIIIDNLRKRPTEKHKIRQTKTYVDNYTQKMYRK